jgi:hypothetical protein
MAGKDLSDLLHVVVPGLVVIWYQNNIDTWEEASQLLRPIASAARVASCYEAQRSKRFDILLAFDDEDGLLAAVVPNLKQLWVTVWQVERTRAVWNPPVIAIWPFLTEAFSLQADYSIVRFS